MTLGWRRLGLLAIAGFALLQSGCLAVVVGAGAAAGCAAGYAYLKGEVPQTYVASFNDTWAAAQTSLVELGMPIVSAEKKTMASGTIRSRLGNGDTVAIQIDEEASTIPADGPVTRVGVRVAMMGDYKISDRILTQIGAHLVPPGAVTRSPAGVPASNPVKPAGWTGVPSITPPPPPQSANQPPASPPAGSPPVSPQPPLIALPASTSPPPVAGLPASTAPPPLAGPDSDMMK